MAVSMIGPKFYAWDRNGKPLAFGKVYTYAARTNAPRATYQSEDGVVENANPVILNGEGYADIYLDGSYKIVVKNKDDSEIWTSDPVTASGGEEWVNCVTATYMSPNSFKVSGNLTDKFDAGRRIRLNDGGVDYDYSTIVSSVFGGGETTVTVSGSDVSVDIKTVCVSIIGGHSIDPAQGSASTISELRNLEPTIDGQQVNLLGHTVAGIGGGVFYYDASDTTSPDNNGTVIVTADGKRWKRKLDGSVSIHMFGGIGNGINDDTSAFISVREYVKTTYRDVIGENPRSEIEVDIPSGEWIITEPQAIMDSSFTTRIVGCKFNGGASSTINYKTSAVSVDNNGANALIHCNNSLLGIQFNNIRFNFDNMNDDFWYSSADGGTQAVTFNSCGWSGNVRRVFDIAGGTDNNSEFVWINGGVSCTNLEQFLNITASDQNVNYWFSYFKFWPEKGTWIRAEKGGHIKIDKTCDVSGHSPSVDTYLFELLGQQHGYGVASFNADGLRIEHKTDYSKLINCEWGMGIVSLVGIDQGSQTSSQSSSVVSCRFNFGASGGPTLNFTDSILIGKHEYVTNPDMFRYISRIKYSSIHHTQIKYPEDFIVITDPYSTPNLASTPMISFTDNCTGSSTYDSNGESVVWDRELNSLLVNKGTVKENTVVLKTYIGGLPLGGENTTRSVLPQGCYITKIDMFMADDSVTSENAYDFQLLDADDKLLARATGASMRIGFRELVDVNYKLQTKNERTIRLIEASYANNPSRDSWCRVTYIG